MTSPQVRLGLITIAPNGGYGQKRYDLTDEGEFQKDKNHAPNVWNGSFQNLTVPGLEAVKDLIINLKPNQVLTLGGSNNDAEQQLVTREQWENSSTRRGLIARTKECLKWSNSVHLLLIDRDPDPDKPYPDSDDFWGSLIEVLPELKGVGRVETASTSSHIYNSVTGQCYKGDSGSHTYIAVEGDVERFTELLKVKFWASGKAYYKLANPNKQTGVRSLLERFPIDLSVFSPERLIFESGAALGEGLEQRRPEPKLYPGDVLDLDALPDLTDEERAIAEVNKTKARAEIKGSQNDAVIEWLVAKEGMSLETAQKEAYQRVKDCERGFIRPSHKLYLEDGSTITAGNLSDVHVGMQLLDPQEPDYDGGRIVAKIYRLDDGSFTIHSFAHGSKKYRIVDDVDQWLIDPVLLEKEPPKGLSAKEIDQWRSKKTRALAKKQFRLLTKLKADLELVADWANEANIEPPKLGEAVLIDAPTGIGKSTVFKQWVNQLSSSVAVGVFADLITHRNSLARSTGEKMGMRHISDCGVNGAPGFVQEEYENADRLTYCIDSLLKRVNGLLKHINRRGGKVLLVLDELHALLEHLLTTTTIGDVKRLSLIANFSVLLQYIGDGHGWIIGGEAHLTHTAVETLKLLSNGKLKIKVCRIKKQNPQPWNVYTYCYPLRRLNVATTDKVRGFLAQGKRVLLMTGSKDAGEHYEILYKEGYKLKRVDSDTIAEEETFHFVKTLNKSVRDAKVQLLIASPSLGIGYDIDGSEYEKGHFDVVVVNASAMDTFTVLQMAGRSRKSVDRHLFMPANSGGGGKFNPKQHRETWKKSDKRLKEYGLSEYQRRRVIEVAIEATANFKALKNAGKSCCYEIVRNLLAEDGHNLIEGNLLDKYEYNELADYYSFAHEQLVKQRLNEYKQAEKLDSVEEANEIIDRDDAPRKERIQAFKTIDYDKYGDRIHDDEFAIKIRCKGYKSNEFRKSYENAMFFENPEMLKEREKERLINSLENTGTFWAANEDSRLALIDLLIDLNFNEVLDHVTSNRYCQDDEVIQQFFDRCKEQRERVYEVCGLTISDKTPIIGFINDFLRKNFAYEYKSTLVSANPKKRGRKNKGDFNLHTLSELNINIKDGEVYANFDAPQKREQKRVYHAVAFPYRDEIVARLKEREESRVAESEKERQMSLPIRSLPVYIAPDTSLKLVGEENLFKLVDEFNGTTTKTADFSPVPVRVRAIA